MMNAPSPVKASGSLAPATQLLALERPLVIGHRGYSALAPENTLAAFRVALTAGVDLVELDYHHSRDGVPVVIHDGTLDRTTDAGARWGGTNLPVSGRTAKELQALDAGMWFSTNHAGARLPLLSEALDFIQRGGLTLIERKAGDAATCVRMLREKGLISHVVVQSFDWDYLRDFHRLAPEQVLGALGPPSRHPDGRKLKPQERVLSAAWLDKARDTGAQCIVWNDQITQEAVAAAHARRLKVWVYTIDEPAIATKLLDMGVDGIISNNPAIIWKALATRPAPRL
jgi:glycerophosphoryl diester phosphodiesterase